MFDYDVVIIGAGSGGLVACKVANGLGKKTALIEKRRRLHLVRLHPEQDAHQIGQYRSPNDPASRIRTSTQRVH